VVEWLELGHNRHGRTGALTVRRIIGFVVASAMTVGGGFWLYFQLFVAERGFGKLIIGACFLPGLGAYWLWVNYIDAAPNRYG
jgi:hypothetical protein